jgi:hypothetical protein
MVAVVVAMVKMLAPVVLAVRAAVEMVEIIATTAVMAL